MRTKHGTLKSRMLPSTLHPLAYLFCLTSLAISQCVNEAKLCCVYNDLCLKGLRFNGR